MQTEAIAVAETAIHFNSGNEILTAEITLLGGSLQTEGKAGANGVAELPRRIGEVLGGKSIHGDVPAFERFGKQKFQLQFIFVLLAGHAIGDCTIGFHVVAFHLLENFVGTADVLIFNVEYGIDEMLPLQNTKPVLPSEARKDSAVVECALGVKIEFGRSPGGGPVLKLAPEGMIVVAFALSAIG